MCDVGNNEIIEVVERLGVKPRDEVVNAAVRLYKVRATHLHVGNPDTGTESIGRGGCIVDMMSLVVYRGGG